MEDNNQVETTTEEKVEINPVQPIKKEATVRKPRVKKETIIEVAPETDNSEKEIIADQVLNEDLQADLEIIIEKGNKVLGKKNRKKLKKMSDKIKEKEKKAKEKKKEKEKKAKKKKKEKAKKEKAKKKLKEKKAKKKAAAKKKKSKSKKK